MKFRLQRQNLKREKSGLERNLQYAYVNRKKAEKKLENQMENCLYKGIFWFKDGEILAVKVLCDSVGNPLEPCVFSSKSGKNFNHKKEWESFHSPLPYNYYPRGRVEITNNKAIVFLHTSLCTNSVKSTIAACFGLHEIKIEWKADGSKHYQSLQWKEEP